mgnify:CR=1 FL=1
MMAAKKQSYEENIAEIDKILEKFENEELLLDEERNDQQVFDKIFVGNIKGAKLEEVMGFVENLSEDDRLLAKEVVAFANR